VTSSGGGVACVPATTPGATTPETETTTTKQTGSDGSETTTTETTTKDPVTGAKSTETTTTGAGGTTKTTSEKTGVDTNGDGVGDGPTDQNQDQQGECEKSPDSPLCKTGTPKAAGTFNSQSAEVTAARQSYQDKLTAISNDLKSVFGTVAAGAGSLPCPPPVILHGKSISFCATDYSDALSPISSAVLLISAFASMLIIFRT
jgi:hypothetical protein